MREMNPPCHLLCLYCLNLKRFSFFYPQSVKALQGDGCSMLHISRSPLTHQCQDANRGGKSDNLGRQLCSSCYSKYLKKKKKGKNPNLIPNMLTSITSVLKYDWAALHELVQDTNPALAPKINQCSLQTAETPDAFSQKLQLYRNE